MPRGPTPQSGRLSKKAPALRLEKLREAHPEAEVELWAEDEARLGLKPALRRVWAPVGRRPIARMKRGYEWTYLYGFVRPDSGEVYWLILPTVNVQMFSMALREFAKEVGAGEQRRVLLVVDSRPAGTRVRRSKFPKGYILSSCLPAHPSYSRRRGCGR
jgi:hypothetical protein